MDFEECWRLAGPAAYGQTYSYFALLGGLSDAVRRELTWLAVLRTRLLARQQFQEGRFRSAQDLTLWVIPRARQEFRRRLPLVYEVNRWIWAMPEEQRRVLLLDYDFWDVRAIAAALGLSRDDAQASLTAARRALTDQIEQAGLNPAGWMEPAEWMV